MSEHTTTQRKTTQRKTEGGESARLASRPFAPLSGGQSLDKHTSAEMSARFGHDFSHVRIHTDRRAGESAQAIGANAFALGGDVVFGEGKFQPGSPETERLLAHELTHVVQQDRWGGPGDWGRASQRGDASEREADALASQVMMGRSVQVQAAPGAAIARDPGAGGAPADDQQEQNSSGGGGAGGGQNSTQSADQNANGGAGGGPNVSVDNSGAGGAPPTARPDIWDKLAKNPVLNSAPYAVATDNTSGLSAIPQAIADANGAKSVANGLGTFGKLLAPLSVASNAVSLAQDVHNDHPVDAVADAAGLGSAAVTTGQMLGYVGATGGAATAGALMGAGAGGYALGNLLANKTEVGDDTVGCLRGLDQKLTGDGQRSAMLRLDEYRQDQWDKGGVGGVAKSIGAGVGEAGLGLVGALGGLGGGLVHGAQWLGRNAAAADQSPGGAGF